MHVATTVHFKIFFSLFTFSIEPNFLYSIFVVLVQIHSFYIQIFNQLIYINKYYLKIMTNPCFQGIFLGTQILRSQSDEKKLDKIHKGSSCDEDEDMRPLPHPSPMPLQKGGKNQVLPCVHKERGQVHADSVFPTKLPFLRTRHQLEGASKGLLDCTQRYSPMQPTVSSWWESKLSHPIAVANSVLYTNQVPPKDRFAPVYRRINQDHAARLKTKILTKTSRSVPKL